jgi:hypothetical protein
LQACFPNFSHDALTEAECKVLAALNYDLVPLSTPSTFVHHFLMLWPDRNDLNMLETAANIANKIIGDFWESELCLLRFFSLLK